MDNNESESYDRLDRILADSFFEGVVSYLKWTSTVTLAAILWIGSNFPGLESRIAAWCAVFSIILLLYSIMTAMLLVKRVVHLRGVEWFPFYQACCTLGRFELGVYSPEDADDLEQALGIGKSEVAADLTLLKDPDCFSRELNKHFVALAIGLVLYVFAFIIENGEILTSINLL